MSQRKPPPKIGAPAAELLPAVLESLLFVAEEPQEIAALARTVELPRQRVEQALEELAEGAPSRGLLVQRHGDRVQLATVPDAAPYIERFLEVEHGRLTRASLETLAIIAYRQPVTRAAIEAIRGVNADHAVSMLLARELIEEVGRAPGPGRPVLFATTVRFLEYFGLRRPEDLPPLPPDPEEEPAPTAEEASGFVDSPPPEPDTAHTEPDAPPPEYLAAGEATDGETEAGTPLPEPGTAPPEYLAAGEARDGETEAGTPPPEGDTPPPEYLAAGEASDGETEAEPPPPEGDTPPPEYLAAREASDGETEAERQSPSPLPMTSNNEPPQAP